MSEKITIGITCYNAEDTIIRALQSAISQTYSDKEIIIVNDASTDESDALINAFLETHKGISIEYIVHDRNQGFPAALNTILKNTKSPYIAFFDDDDVSTPERLSKQMERIKQYNMTSEDVAVFCYTNRSIFLPGTIKSVDTVKAIGRHPPEPRGSDVADFILWRSYNSAFTWGLFGSCTLLTKTSNLISLGYFDEEFRRSAEIDMAIRASFKNACFIAVDEPLVFQYKTPTQDKSGKIPLLYNLKLRKKYKEYLKNKGVYAAAKCLARYQYYNNKKNKPMMALWMAFACISAPKKILFEKLKSDRKNTG